MGIALDTETELLLMLDLALNESQECEHTYHNEDPSAHSGEAAWYLKPKCPGCGIEYRLLAYCDKWYRYTRSVGEVICVGVGSVKGCRGAFPGKDWILVVEERIK